MGLIEKDGGFEYHPEMVTNQQSKKKKKREKSTKTVVAEKQAEMVLFMMFKSC